MDYLIITAVFMVFNVFLATIPILFVQILIRTKFIFVEFLSGLVWFFFLPNTVYLITDISNLQLPRVQGPYFSIYVLIFLVLIPIGVVTYVMSVYPLEKKIFKKNVSYEKHIYLFILNLFIGFGLVLGRVLRVNSWEVVTNINNVITNSFKILYSRDLLVLVLVFAIICQVIYFVFRDPVVRKLKLK